MIWILVILLGMLLIIVDLLTHPHTLSLFVIFPVIVGEGGILSVMGIVLVFIGILLAFLYPFTVIKRETAYESENHYGEHFEELSTNELEFDKEPKKEASWGGFVIIGPLPIFFGSFKGTKYAKYLIPITILFGIMFIILSLMYVFKYYLP